jgi:hypothetical protein
MDLRDFAGRNFTGGSALMNNARPLVSTVLTIWALAPGAKTAAHKTNAPK